MAGPIIRLSVAAKDETSQRFDIFTAWSDERIENQLRVKIADTTTDAGEQYAAMTIPDFIRSLAEGRKYYLNLRFDKARFLAWLQSAPIEAQSNGHRQQQAEPDPF